MISFLLFAALSFLASAAIVKLVLEFSRRRGLFDVPNQRSSHSVPTPRMGGLGIALTTLAVFASSVREWSLVFSLILVTSSVIALVSLLDDLRGVSALSRLCVQIACGTLSMIFIVRPFETHSGKAWSLVVVGVFWTVGCTNAFNFMDGIDGIAAGQAIVSGLALESVGLLMSDRVLSFSGAAIVGSAAGFLLFNAPPAKIFMGDVGSAFLGYFIAVLSAYALIARPRIGLIVPMSLWPFLFDATITLLRRAVRRERVFQAHKSHIYQRLVAAGFSHARVSLLYTLLALFGLSVGALAVRSTVPIWLPSVLLALFAMSLLAAPGLAERATPIR